jgi:hypothetical protein
MACSMAAFGRGPERDETDRAFTDARLDLAGMRMILLG